MVSSYAPKIDVTTLFDVKDTQYYQELVGMLLWSIKLGHVNY